MMRRVMIHVHRRHEPPLHDAAAIRDQAVLVGEVIRLGLRMLAERPQVVAQVGEAVHRQEPEHRVCPPADGEREPAEEQDLPTDDDRRVACPVSIVRLFRQHVRIGRLASHEHVAHGRQDGAGADDEHEELVQVGLVEAGVPMPVRILVGAKMQVVAQVVAVVEPRDRRQGADQEKVGEQVVAGAVGEHAPVQSVVPDDEQCVVARADHRQRQQHRPPGGMQADDGPRAEDDRPAERRVEHGAAGPQLAERAHAVRRQQDRPVRVVGAASGGGEGSGRGRGRHGRHVRASVR